MTKNTFKFETQEGDNNNIVSEGDDNEDQNEDYDDEPHE